VVQSGVKFSSIFLFFGWGNAGGLSLSMLVNVGGQGNLKRTNLVEGVVQWVSRPNHLPKIGLFVELD